MSDLAGDFFRSTVKPTVDEFLASPWDIRRGRLAALVLYHMADYWAAERYESTVTKQDLAKKMRDELPNLRKELIKKCPDFQLIRDVADASKHAKLAFPRILSSSDQITASQGIFAAPFGAGVFNSAAEITAELDDGTKKSLTEAVRSVLDMWDAIIEK
ncbi:hypothetical protein [Nitrospirillum viridazoti]|uniref:hypothetical protein n=1 Tax=Nitrospirillum viridazoti TaxID=3144925 RepID=UPI000A306381|nr:hypothetical protein [Nitrospirillum amazonense]